MTYFHAVAGGFLIEYLIFPVPICRCLLGRTFIEIRDLHGGFRYQRSRASRTVPRIVPSVDCASAASPIRNKLKQSEKTTRLVITDLLFSVLVELTCGQP